MDIIEVFTAKNKCYQATIPQPSLKKSLTKALHSAIL